MSFSRNEGRILRGVSAQPLGRASPVRRGLDARPLPHPRRGDAREGARVARRASRLRARQARRVARGASARLRLPRLRLLRRPRAAARAVGGAGRGAARSLRDDPRRPGAGGGRLRGRLPLRVARAQPAPPRNAAARGARGARRAALGADELARRGACGRVDLRGRASRTQVATAQNLTPWAEFYEGGLRRGVDTLYWMPAHVEDSLLLRRYTHENRHEHFFTLAPETWDRVRRLPWTAEDGEALLGASAAATSRATGSTARSCATSA